MKITNELIEKVEKWLGKDGKEFFKWCTEKHGSISPVYSEGTYGNGRTLLHPVHFREGMKVRNFIRKTGLCDDWDAHDLDDNWTEVVKRALDIE